MVATREVHRGRRDLVVCAVAFAAILGGVSYYSLFESLPENTKFAWEYGNTAEALVTGRGFANPFEGVESGPTAWMPPAYVLLIAGVFAVFGIKSTASLWVLLALKSAGLAVALGCLLRLADEAGLTRYRWWMLPAYLGPLYVSRYPSFVILHDPWLHVLLSCVLLLAWARESRRRPLRRPVLTLLAVVLPLTSPSLALAFALLVVVRALRDLRSGTRFVAALVPAVVLLAAFGASAGVWTARNFAVFGVFIPVKSNLWFDFVQANEIDDDGLVTHGTFTAFNPSNRNETQRHYAEVGEGRFTVEYRGRARALVVRNPGEVLRRIGRRAWSAFVLLHDPDDDRPVDPDAFAERDLEALRAAGLVTNWLGEWSWLCISWPEERVKSVLSATLAHDTGPALADWARARAEYLERKTHWRLVFGRLAITAIPTLFLIAGFLCRSVRNQPVFVVAAAIYLVYLAPYVVISHYLRYQAPMIGIQAVFSFFAAVTVLETWRRASGREIVGGSPAPSRVT